MNDDKKRLRPVIILPEKAMTKADMGRLRANGIVVVEAKDPSQVRFCEPPPEGYSAQEKAAIQLCRFLLRSDTVGVRNRHDIAAAYAHYVIQGTPLCENPPKQIERAKK